MVRSLRSEVLGEDMPDRTVIGYHQVRFDEVLAEVYRLPMLNIPGGKKAA